MEEVNKRMTWEEIVEKYPDQWVGIAEAELDGSTILSGVVRYTGMDRGELAMIQFTTGEIMSVYTSPDHLNPLGIAGCLK